MSLVLTRRPHECIMIGEDITITVLGMKGNSVKLSINAPREVPVHRREVYCRIKREEAEAEDTDKHPTQLLS